MTMKKLFRGLWWSVLSLVLLVGMMANFAHAAMKWTGVNNNNGGAGFGSPMLSCQARVTPADYGAIHIERETDVLYRCHANYQNNLLGSSGLMSGTCDPGTVFDSPTGECKVPPAAVCTFGQTTEVLLSAGTATVGGGTTDMSAPTNVQGCGVGPVELLGCFSASGKGVVGEAIKCRWKVTKTGVSLGATSTGKQPTAEVPADKQEPAVPPFNAATGQGCPKGTVNMGTDAAGGSICGGSGSAPAAKPAPPVTTKPPVTSTTPSGSTLKTDVTERLNADGSKTTFTKLTETFADGTSTVTENEMTSKTPAGDTGKKDDSKEEQKLDFCKSNPGLNICKNSQVLGACETLTCTGDAIQCAIAKQAAEANCRAQKDSDLAKASPQYALGNAALAGNDPMAGSYPNPKAGTSYVMPSSLDGQGWLGTRACFSDKSFVVQGRTIAIPFSKLCDYLIVFRGVMMIIAALVCFKMLRTTILQE